MGETRADLPHRTRANTRPRKCDYPHKGAQILGHILSAETYTVRIDRARARGSANRQDGLNMSLNEHPHRRSCGGGRGEDSDRVLPPNLPRYYFLFFFSVNLLVR